jgi:hypothetical protein
MYYIPPQHGRTPADPGDYHAVPCGSESLEAATIREVRRLIRETGITPCERCMAYHGLDPRAVERTIWAGGSIRQTESHPTHSE